MINEKIWKTLKYRNVGYALAVCLLVIVSISTSCSKKTNLKTDDSSLPDSSLSDSNESKADAIPTENQYTSEQISTDHKYIEIRTDSILKSGLLCPADSNNSEAPEDLEGVYAYLFSGDKQIAYTRSTQIELDKTTLIQFQKMLVDFYKETKNNTIMITEGYVSEDDDLSSDDDHVKTSECGEHELATSIDLQLYMSDGTYPEYTGDGDYVWVTENMSSYGFITRYGEGKSDITGVTDCANHIRYVGYPSSQIMYDKNLCLEEYMDFIKSYDYKTPLVLIDTLGGKYAVYYVAAATDGNTTNVAIPISSNDEEYPAVISGNGKDGYIITCTINENSTDSSADT